MLRIIAGDFRSRRLLAPQNEAVSRPYSQRAKEAVFNMLREWFDGARVLDLFAGVGTMGLEAVSRGAAQVVMVERDRTVYDLLRRNIESLGCRDRAFPVRGDALGDLALVRAPKPVDITFVDPPYSMIRDESDRGRVLRQIARIPEVMTGRGFVVLRSPLNPATTNLVVEGLDGPEAHRYGSAMWVLLYSRPAP